MTMTTESSESMVPHRIAYEFFGSTVVGPRHCAEGRPNEDSWLGVSGAFGTLIVVSDGVGSKSNARRGSQMACRAVHDAVRAWHKENSRCLDGLLTRIEPLWLSLVAPAASHDCAATCMFALAHSYGLLHVAAIGDGLAVRQTPQQVDWITGDRAGAFLNETTCLGDSAPWKSQTFQCHGEESILLATDGVADDLLPERVDDFVRWLIENFASMPPRLRWRAIQRELRDWPTPHHTDDKTLVVLTPKKAVHP